MSRSEFIARWKQRIDANDRSQEESAQQRSQWLNRALDEYSRCCPLRNVQATITISPGDTEVVLPADVDLARLERKQFSQLLSGTSVSLFGWGCYPAGNPLYLNPPFSGRPAQPGIMDPDLLRIERKTVAGVSRIVWTLPSGSASTITGNIVYTANHRVEDDPPVNTLDSAGEQAVMDLMHGYFLEYMGQKFARIGRPDATRQSENYYTQARSMIEQARASFAPPTTV